VRIARAKLLAAGNHCLIEGYSDPCVSKDRPFTVDLRAKLSVAFQSFIVISIDRI